MCGGGDGDEGEHGEEGMGGAWGGTLLPTLKNLKKNNADKEGPPVLTKNKWDRRKKNINGYISFSALIFFFRRPPERCRKKNIAMVVPRGRGGCDRPETPTEEERCKRSPRV